MNTAIFETKLLQDGHLYCPKEFAQKKNALFKVIVIFEDTETEASVQDFELSAINDNSTDFLSEEELKYYLCLEEL
jgi:hypothetical protein